VRAQLPERGAAPEPPDRNKASQGRRRQEWSSLHCNLVSSIMQMMVSINSKFRCSTIAALTFVILAWSAFILTDRSQASPDEPLHYAPNSNFATNGQYLPAKVGFNLADVSTVTQLDSLSAGLKGLVWVGQCNGADEKFRRVVEPYIGNSKVFGFFLMDDPDPRDLLESGKLSIPCTPDNLKAESDWVHSHLPGAKTFIVLMNLSSSKTPSFENTYNPANSHIDLFGLDPYPCRTELNGCDYDMIDRYVAAAIAWGIPRSRMVPFYQSFGGGDWVDDYGGQYLLPTADQTRKTLDRWKRCLDAPVFDAVYSWGSQRADAALESAVALQKVFLVHNHARGMAKVKSAAFKQQAAKGKMSQTRLNRGHNRRVRSAF
jgi:hypothetical protein